MAKSDLEDILSKKDRKKGRDYKKYYAAIAGTFTAGNFLAYFSYGTKGLLDAIGIDLVTLGLTIYESMKEKKTQEKIDYYIDKLNKLEEKEKIGIISCGEKPSSDSKVKKLGFIVYQLLKKDTGMQPEIERDGGIGDEIISTLESKGYIHKGIFGTKLTKKGKEVYRAMLYKMENDKDDMLAILRRLYSIKEEELLPIYQLYIDALNSNDNKK